MVSVPFGPLLQLPPAQGTGPATRPLSKRQLKLSHGSFLEAGIAGARLHCKLRRDRCGIR